jgi:hypothetical protein
MTASEYLREKASKLRHAIGRGTDVFDSNHKLLNKIEPEHYLTCERCRLEREANELERTKSS